MPAIHSKSFSLFKGTVSCNMGVGAVARWKLVVRPFHASRVSLPPMRQIAVIMHPLSVHTSTYHWWSCIQSVLYLTGSLEMMVVLALRADTATLSCSVVNRPVLTLPSPSQSAGMLTVAQLEPNGMKSYRNNLS